MARYRKKIPRKRSKSLFRKTAMRTNKRNLSPKVMRGGIRL